MCIRDRGKDMHEIVFLCVVLILIAASWALRPPTRTLRGRPHDQDMSVKA